MSRSSAEAQGVPPQEGEHGRYDAFLSYAREDLPFAERLVEALREKGQRVWLDVRGIPGGAPWRRHQARALEACKAFVFLLGPESLASENCQEELAQAQALKKLVIPVYHREVAQEKLPPVLADPEWIFLREEDPFDAGVAGLADALSVDLGWREQHTRLAMRAREWEDSQRDKSFLLRGTDLRDAESWLGGQGGHRQTPTALQTEFIVGSRRGALSRQRRLMLAIAAAFVLTAALALFAFLQRNNALDQKRSAQSRSLAVQARALARIDLDAGALLALEAYRLKPTIEARDTLLAIVPDLQRAHPVFSRRIPGLMNLSASEENGIVALSEGVGKIRWLDPVSGKTIDRESVPAAKRFALVSSPDRELLAFGGTIADVWVWNRDRRKVVAHLHDPLGGIPAYEILFSPDNRAIAIVYETGVRLWDLSSGRHRDLSPPQREQLSFMSQATAFSPDGRLLAAGSIDGCVYLWSVDGGRLAQPWLCGDSPVTSLAFSHRGDRLAVGERNGVARVWQLGGRARESVEAEVHRGPVAAVAFGRDEMTVASAGEDGTLSIWDGKTGRLAEYRIERNPNISSFSGQGAFDDLAFDASGETLVAINGGEGRAWDASRGDAFGDQVGDGGIAFGDAVSPDGQLVAVKSSDYGATAVWNRRTGERVPLAGAESTGPLEFSSDGDTIVAQGDAEAMVWDAASGDLKHAFSHTLDPTTVGSRQSVALSPDEKLIATTKDYPEEKGDDFGVQIWNAADGDLVQSLRSPFGYETSDVAFSPAGELLAATGIGEPYRGTIQIWETSRWAPVARRSIGQSQELSGLAFSPDGEIIATAGDPGPVRLWRVPDLEPLGRPIFADVDVVPALAFSPDGETLATGGEDGRIRFWDVATQELLGQALFAHSQWVDTIRFSSDGSELISVGDEGIVRAWDSILWASDPSQLQAFVCGAVGHDLSAAEWSQLVPEEPYRATCSG